MTSDPRRHAGRVVIVTGAASGIGRATAERFIAEGARVVLADVNADALDETVAELSAGDTVMGVVVDVTDAEAVDAMVQRTVERFGRLDVLVNNAGIGRMGHVTELTPQQWRRTMAVNLDAVFYGSRAAIPHLAATRGCIVNTASISGLFSDYGLAAYSASKGGVVTLTRNMAVDHAADGVRVNSVCPGPVRTEITAKMMDEPEMAAAYAELIPLARVGEASEMAAAISFLASDDASYITGHNLVVDGGVTAVTGQPNFHRLYRPKLAPRQARSAGGR
jgi:meso-butanediol dehydrogenase/(S,S)-butanediol dehydrogenase/diacetyl reductase